jgi:hypothetical protein
MYLLVKEKYEAERLEITLLTRDMPKQRPSQKMTNIRILVHQVSYRQRTKGK